MTAEHDKSRGFRAAGLSAATVGLVVVLLLVAGRSGRNSPAVPVRVYPHPKAEGSFLAQFSAMGTDARLQVQAAGLDDARRMCEAAAQRVWGLEALMSTYSPGSEVSALNGPGRREFVPLSPDTLAVIAEAKRMHALTDGAFEVTYAPLRTLWRHAQELGRVPQPQEVEKALAMVGLSKLTVKGARARLDCDGMEVDLGGIAKGYAIDSAAEMLQHSGAESGIVDIGGDMRLFGRMAPGRDWRVRVRQVKGAAADHVLTLPPCAVATSGDYERGFRIGDKRYSHIVDPRTGWPVENMTSVTVVAPDAISADGLATGLSVLGVERGIEIVDSLPGVECLIMERRADGSVRDHASAGFPKLMEKP